MALRHTDVWQISARPSPCSSLVFYCFVILITRNVLIRHARFIAGVEFHDTHSIGHTTRCLDGIGSIKGLGIKWHFHKVTLYGNRSMLHGFIRLIGFIAMFHLIGIKRFAQWDHQCHIPHPECEILFHLLLEAVPCCDEFEEFYWPIGIHSWSDHFSGTSFSLI